MAMAQQRLADTGTALEGMVHVTEDHQIGGSVLGHAIQGKSQILIPQSTAGVFQSRPQGLAASDPKPEGPQWAITIKG